MTKVNLLIVNLHQAAHSQLITHRDTHTYIHNFLFDLGFTPISVISRRSAHLTGFPEKNLVNTKFISKRLLIPHTKQQLELYKRIILIKANIIMFSVSLVLK